MLHDNAQLARVYLHAWQVTGNEFFRTVTEESLGYAMREMTYVGTCANEQQLRPEPRLPYAMPSPNLGSTLSGEDQTDQQST